MNASYLITGGTGSLGREIVPRILAADPNAEIALLLRGRTTQERGAKWDELKRYLVHYGSGAALDRVRPFPGDVTLAGLGLSWEDERELRRRTTHVIHAAAGIRLLQPLSTARAINVGGALQILAFAERCPGLERLVHISTAYVAGNRSGLIREDELDLGQRYRNPYEQSKAEAEALMRGYRGRLPITVLRPSIIVGDSSDGRTCNFETLYHPLRRIALGLLTEIPGDPDTRLDLVPVDFVADGAVQLARDRAAVGGTYHLTAGPERSIAAAELVGKAARLGGHHPPRFTMTSGDDRGSRLGLGAFFAYLAGSKAFDDAHLRRDLGPRAPRPPHAREYLGRLFAFCESTAWGRDLPWERPASRMAA